ncbi:MAG: CHAT domain-containing protein [Planctomycetes bacterium]|nr:CHAT domain-containing protein [Planctomycetota bacterium]
MLVRIAWMVGMFAGPVLPQSTAAELLEPGAIRQLQVDLRAVLPWDPDKARAVEPRVIATFEAATGANPELAARLATSWGNVLSRGRPRDALPWFERAVATAESAKLSALVGSAALRWASLCTELSDYGAALPLCDRAEAAFGALGDEGIRGLIGADMCRSNALLNLGHWNRALAAADRAARVVRELHAETGRDGAGIAQVAGTRGIVLSRMGRYAEALQAYETAREYFEGSADERALASLEGNVANVYSALGRLDEAAAGLERAARYYRASGDVALLARALNNLGFVHSKAHRPGEALAVLAEAEVLCRELGDEYRLARSLVTRSRVLEERGELAAAMTACETARAIFERGNCNYDLGILGIAETRLLRAMDQPERALAAADGAERQLELTGEPGDLALVDIERGNLHLRLGRPRPALAAWAAAAERVRTAIASVRGIGADASRTFREVHGNLPASAVNAFHGLEDPTAGELEQCHAVVQTLYGVGAIDVLDAGDPARSAPTPALRDEIDAALSEVRRADVALEDRRTGSLAATTTAELLAGRDAERAARDRLLQATRALDRLLERDRIARAQRFARPELATAADVRDALPPDVALVEFVVSDLSLHALVATAESTDVVEFADPGGIADRATRLAELLASDRSASARELRDLGRALLDPIDNVLPKRTRTLLIAPRGALCRIPFELLLTGEPTTEDRREWPYLIAERDVGYVPSGTALVTLRRLAPVKRPVHGRAFVALGHPAARGRLPELPRSATEVLGIASAFATTAAERAQLDAAAAAITDGREPASELNGEQFAVYLRERAAEATLRLDTVRSAGILHLACHAQVDTAAPRLSRLVLTPAAGDSGDDGYLYLRELQDLDLSCDLLVLSSCASNVGPLSRVDGMIGLTQAGFAAGADAVMSTLWAIPDREAGTFVQSFYRELRAADSSRLAALGKAKRGAIAAGAAGRVWSAFVLWDAAVTP